MPQDDVGFASNKLISGQTLATGELQDVLPSYAFVDPATLPKLREALNFKCENVCPQKKNMN